MNSMSGANSNRRDFFQLVLGWGAALFAFCASLAGAARFMIPNVLYEPNQRCKLLKPEEYEEGATFIAESRLFLVRKGNTFRAVSGVCTHLGCTVLRNSKGNGFHCPCHGSQFNENAVVTGGPAPRPLPWYLVELSRDGRLVVNAAHVVAADKYLVV
ncbi:MAG: ubiquinol-cytochrome c reductase iron-sulfur subunit [Verrucomicrobia bacterium]|nr:MAG: ubiquinol-cytochrome c reductase iron-sulfur subunit [Verrucomicrobiota bacterium]